MKRRIIAYRNYYKDFFESLDEGTQEKILYGMLLLKTQERLPSKFVKPIRDGQKTPTKEINKALKLKAEYEERKKQGDF